MSSSTSNFRRAFAIAILVLLAFALVEVVTRRVLFASSKDIKRFSTYGARAAKLVRDDKPSIAFVGNSITERGVDPAVIANDLGVRADVFTADDSHLNTWTWIVRMLFWKQQRTPDVLVITFHAHSLEDGRSIELGRVAHFFTDPSDWSELFDSTVTTLGERAELVASSYWATYAVRDRIRERLLGLAPGYKQLVTFENKAMKVRESSTPRSPTWKTLVRFLELARAHHTRVVFVAFPAQVTYYLAPEAVQLIEQAGMKVLDLRVMPELAAPTNYDDEIHLSASGRAIFTKRLAKALAPIN